MLACFGNDCFWRNAGMRGDSVRSRYCLGHCTNRRQMSLWGLAERMPHPSLPLLIDRGWSCLPPGLPRPDPCFDLGLPQPDFILGRHCLRLCSFLLRSLMGGEGLPRHLRLSLNKTHMVGRENRHDISTSPLTSVSMPWPTFTLVCKLARARVCTHTHVKNV